MNNIAIIRDAIEKVTKILAGIDVPVTQRGDEAFVKWHPKTGKPIRVNVPYLPDNATEALQIAIQGFLDHEVAHILFTDFKAIEKSLEEGQSFKNLHNVVEDCWIEPRMEKLYRGSQRNLGYTRRLVFGEKSKENFEALESNPNATEYEWWSSCYVTIFRALAGHAECIEIMDTNNRWQHVSNVVKILDFFRDDLEKCKSTWDTLELTRKVIQAFKDSSPEDQNMSDFQDKGDDDQEKQQDSGENQSEQENQETESSENKEEGKGANEQSSNSSRHDKLQNEGNDESRESDSKDDLERTEAEDDSDDEGSDKENQNSSDDSQGEENSSNDSGVEGEPKEAEQGEDTGESDQNGEFDLEDQDEDQDEDQEDGQDGDTSSNDNSDNDDEGSKCSDKNSKEDSGEIESKDTESKNVDVFIGNIDDLQDFEDQLRQNVQEMYRIAVSGDDLDWLVFSRDHCEPENFPKVRHNQKHIVEMHDGVKSIIGPMAKHLERMIMAQKRFIYEPGKRSGRLHQANLHRLKQNDTRVFRRKIENNIKDTAVQILVDMSGSMSGDKIKTASYAAYALAEMLQRCAIPCEVIAFSTAVFKPDYERELEEAQNRIGRNFSVLVKSNHFILKTWRERVDVEISQRFATLGNQGYGSWMNGNCDPEALETGALSLARRREERKIMMVLSDGMPAFYGDVRAGERRMREIVATCEKNKMEIIGIGIQSDDVKDYYPKNVVINSVDQLPRAITGSLQKLLLG